MARQQSVGILRAWYVPTISNTAAPTTAEVNAGVDLTPNMVRNGLKTPQTAQLVDASDVSSLYNKTSRGTYGGDPVEITCYRDSVSGTDNAYTTLVPGTVGYLVVRRFGGSAVAIASTNKVEVWTIEVASRSMADIAENEDMQFTAVCAVTAAPVDTATVA